MREYTKCLLFLVLGMFSYCLGYSQAERKVSGIVRDSVGQGIPGISVTVKGKKTTTVTDGQGRFTIPVASSEDVLEFTSVGYETVDMPAGDNVNITVNMKSSAGNLNEVVVTAL
ncbi:MAG TPA: carboxypeptidase-like regulatory domain-containing protein, partial [Flavisolibacter sp.]|nr:carboxypeptidase-like regulatory domain-containing protein [Flavisolibacter sp.]